MTDHDTDEALPTEMTALLELEKDGYPEDMRLKAEVLSHVERAVVLHGPSGYGRAGMSSASSAAAMAARKMRMATFAALVVGAAAGAAAMAGLDRRSGVAPQASDVQNRASATPSAIVSTSANATTEPAALAPSTTLPSTPADVVGEGAAARPSSSAAPASSVALTSASRGDLAKERELLDVARAALARHRAAEALATAEQHAQKWPHGHLVEERDVVRIQALVMAGRRQDAERYAAQFRRTFPNSMLMPAVDAALSEGP